MIKKYFIAVILIITFPSASYGEELEYSPYLDGTITLGLISVGTGLEIYARKTSDDGCNWCSQNPFDNSARDLLRWDNPDNGVMMSNIFLFSLPAIAVAPFLLTKEGALRKHNKWGKFISSALIVVESVATSFAFQQGAKIIASRERPYVRNLSPGQKQKADDNMSFYSGHTSTAFSLAVSSIMVSHFQNYDPGYLVYGATLAVALGTGYFRIAGDKHYLTDVMTGAVMGSLIGFFVPFLHKTSQKSKIKSSAYIMPSKNGFMAGYGIVF